MVTLSGRTLVVCSSRDWSSPTTPAMDPERFAGTVTAVDGAVKVRAPVL